MGVWIDDDDRVSRHVTVGRTSLISGQLLVRNTAWSLLGLLTPLLAAVFAIPPLVDRLGNARFGVLALAWLLAGYFSLFDLGLGRALTKLVAERLGAGREDEVSQLAWTGLRLMAGFGVLGGLVLVALAPWLAEDVLEIPAYLRSETRDALYVLGVAIPVVVIAAGLRGILEAYQRFRTINAVRIPLGVFTFAGPLATTAFTDSLVPIVAVLLLGRMAAAIAYAVNISRTTSGIRPTNEASRGEARVLLAFGGWMTVSNIVSPLMSYMDRFLIATLVSVTAVAYYAAPYEAVTKIIVLPTAVMAVMFPAFSTAFTGDLGRSKMLYRRALFSVFSAVFPLALAAAMFAHEGLDLWLGFEFADNATVALKILAVGVLLNSVSQVPFGLVQAAGRPDLTAKLHFLEFPLYLIALWWLVQLYGIDGAAAAWTGRIVLDTTVLVVLARRLLHRRMIILSTEMILLGGGIIVVGLGAAVPGGLTLKAALLATVVVLVGGMMWLRVLGHDERTAIRQFVRSAIASRRQDNADHNEGGL